MTEVDQSDTPCFGCGGASDVPMFSLRPPPVTDELIPVVNPALSATVVDGSVVLYDSERATSHLLNSSAATIWASIDDESSVATLVARVAGGVGIEPGAIDADVRRALGDFAIDEIVWLEDPTDGGAAPDVVGPDPVRAVSDAGRGNDESRWAARIVRYLEQVSWEATIGPRRAGCATFAARTNSPEVHAALVEVLASLPPAAEADVVLSVLDGGEPGQRRFRVFADGVLLASRETARSAVELALAHVNRIAVEGAAGMVVVHGGAVDDDGRAVVVLGPSRRGKSTLTAALVRRGFAYVTDEVVSLDPASFALVPFPKAFGLDRGALGRLGLREDAPEHGKAHVSPERVGPISAGNPRLALVVVLTTESLDEPMVELQPAEALLEVLANTFAETMELPDGLDVLAAICERTPVIRLARGDLDDMCSLVVQSLEAGSGSSPDE